MGLNIFSIAGVPFPEGLKRSQEGLNMGLNIFSLAGVPLWRILRPRELGLLKFFRATQPPAPGRGGGAAALKNFSPAPAPKSRLCVQVAVRGG